MQNVLPYQSNTRWLSGGYGLTRKFLMGKFIQNQKDGENIIQKMTQAISGMRRVALSCKTIKLKNVPFSTLHF